MYFKYSARFNFQIKHCSLLKIYETFFEAYSKHHEVMYGKTHRVIGRLLHKCWGYLIDAANNFFFQCLLWAYSNKPVTLKKNPQKKVLMDLDIPISCSRCRIEVVGLPATLSQTAGIYFYLNGLDEYVLIASH